MFHLKAEGSAQIHKIFKQTARAAVIALFCMSTLVEGATVYSSTFSDLSNVGVVGGIIGSGADVGIGPGGGPWKGTYQGIDLPLPFPDFLAPTLSISNSGGFGGTGSATIADVIGADLGILGIVNNFGWFSVDTGLTYQPNSSYTLSVNVLRGGAISDLSLLTLANTGVGIALTDDAGVVATSTAISSLISLEILDADWYRLRLQYETGDVVPTGNIGIRLFDNPTSLITTDLLSGVSFSNVVLDEVVTPEPSTSMMFLLGLAGVGFAGYRKRRQVPTV